MPRNGVSYEVVAAAAGRLVARGNAEPNAKDVREELASTLPAGTPVGSPNTIQRHLAAWRVTSKPIKVEEFPGMPTGLAAQFVKELTRAADEARAAAETRLVQLQGDVTELVAAGEQMEDRVDALTSELDDANAQRARMSGQLDERTQELSDTRARVMELSTRQTSLEQDLATARITALEANGRLDEVRAAAERQRAEDRTALAAAQDQVAQLKTQLAQLQVEHARNEAKLAAQDERIMDLVLDQKIARETDQKAREMEARWHASTRTIDSLEKHVATLTATIQGITAMGQKTKPVSAAAPEAGQAVSSRRRVAKN